MIKDLRTEEKLTKKEERDRGIGKGERYVENKILRERREREREREKERDTHR